MTNGGSGQVGDEAQLSDSHSCHCTAPLCSFMLTGIMGRYWATQRNLCSFIMDSALRCVPLSTPLASHLFFNFYAVGCLVQRELERIMVVYIHT